MGRKPITDSNLRQIDMDIIVIEQMFLVNEIGFVLIK